MVTREDWEAGAPVAITSADVPRVVAAYIQAAQNAELVRQEFARVGLPHGEGDVSPTLDVDERPQVRVVSQSAMHQRACENVVAALSGGPARFRRRARRRDEVDRATPPPATA